MTRFLIVFIIILAFGCKPENLSEIKPKKNPEEFKLQASKSDIIFDTLIFDKNMYGNLLAEKYAFGLQELQFYKQFVSENKISKKQILSDEHMKTEIIYLGKLMDLNKQNSYHVITNFKIIGIGEMESPRGISNIAFINDSLNKAIIYRMGVPNELPEKIENNVLYFNHESEKIGISIFGGLPPMLCVPTIGCN